MAYSTPFTPGVTKAYRAVGIGVFDVHVSVAGSYASTVGTMRLLYATPPTAYSVPFTTPTASRYRAVGMDAFVVHVSVAGSYASTVAKYRCGSAYPPMA